MYYSVMYIVTTNHIHCHYVIIRCPPNAMAFTFVEEDKETMECTVYALTFAGFHGFRGSVAILDSFIPLKFRPDGQRFCSDVTNRENKNTEAQKLSICESLIPQKLKHIGIELASSLRGTQRLPTPGY